MSTESLIDSIANAITEADKQFAAPCMMLKREEAEVYAKAAIAAIYEDNYGKTLPSEISDADLIEDLAHDADFHACARYAPHEAAKEAVRFLKPYLRTTEPVSVEKGEGVAPAEFDPQTAIRNVSGKMEDASSTLASPSTEQPVGRTLFDPNIHCDAERVIAWIDNSKRKAAQMAFTEGLERQIAYRFEDAAMKRESIAPPPESYPAPTYLTCKCHVCEEIRKNNGIEGERK